MDYVGFKKSQCTQDEVFVMLPMQNIQGKMQGVFWFAAGHRRSRHFLHVFDKRMVGGQFNLADQTHTVTY